MAGDKSEQPTPKRMNEARKKGQVFKSRDFIQSLLFITAALSSPQEALLTLPS